MGSVWEGVHETLGTRVAVKLIEVEHVQSGDSRRRFETEARAAAMLQSKHVVEVYDYGVSPDGHPFIVMQYLAGEPLDRRLEREGRLNPVDTARILIQVCRALARAHALGIIHRDLKPENIFLMRDQEDGTELAKVVDFGIAKVVGGSGSTPEESATRTGSVLGTPYYMSPEQARGLRSVDHRSDLWSVGVIAFRCMVGRLPFQGEAVGDVLVNLCTGPIPVPSELVSNLPPAFDGWIQRALSRTPTERFSTAVELGESLAVVCGLTTPMAPYAGDTHASDPHLGHSGQRIITPGPLDEQAIVPPLHPASKSGNVSVTFRSPTGLTGSATTNTPPPRQNVPTIIVATVLATLIAAVGIAALTRLGSSPSEEPSAASPAPTTAPPAPSTLPADVAVRRPSEPEARTAPTTETAPPLAPSAAASAATTPPASGPVASSAKVAGPSRTSAPPKKTQEAAGAATQSLEIRLER
jgi:eukaryotic-like serine/threonine-protein kinase